MSGLVISVIGTTSPQVVRAAEHGEGFDSRQPDVRLAEGLGVCNTHGRTQPTIYVAGSSTLYRDVSRIAAFDTTPF